MNEPTITITQAEWQQYKREHEALVKIKVWAASKRTISNQSNRLSNYATRLELIAEEIKEVLP